MQPTQLFERVIAMFVAVIVLHWLARRLRLPAPLALIAGGIALAFAPGLPSVAVDPTLVLVLFLPPLLMDSAWTIPLGQLRRHKVGVASLAVGAVVFTAAVVALLAHWLLPALPVAACAALGAVVAPPDAVAARALLEHIALPRRLRILLEGESLLNDATGLVLFRFAVAAGVAGAFNATAALGMFCLLAGGGALVGIAVGFVWVKLVRRLGDEYLIIAATMLISWTSYLLAETLHVSGVFATVAAALIASWHGHTVLSASVRMRGRSFWQVLIFLLEAVIFMLIGLSLLGVVERAGGFDDVIARYGLPSLCVLAGIVAARFAWMFGSDAAIALGNRLGFRRHAPVGARGSVVLAWAGVRGVVTLAMALSVPEGFPGRDVILVAAFVAILGTVLLQATTLGRVIAWASLSEDLAEKPRMTMSQAESAMAQVQFKAIEANAYDADGKLVHERLLKKYRTRATRIVDYAERPEAFSEGLHAHFNLVLVAVARGRDELVRLHRSGEIDDDTLHELERDLDLEELGAMAAMNDGFGPDGVGAHD